MIELAAEVLVVVTLLLVFIQDLKYRAIHVLLPLFIGMIGLYIFIEQQQNYTIILYNFFFLLCTFVGLYLYLFAKNNRHTNPFISMGIGDFLFFVAVIPYFSTTNYILYFITGMLFSILTFTIIKALSKTELVPLAGLLAIYLVILKGISYWTDLSFFNDTLL